MSSDEEVERIPANTTAEGDTVLWDAQLKWPVLVTRVERHDNGTITWTGITELSSTVYDGDHLVARVPAAPASSDGET